MQTDHTQRIAILPPSNDVSGRLRPQDRGRDRLRDVRDIAGCILHTTGYGPGVEALDKRHGSDEATIGHAFAVRQASVLDYKPHFLIGRDGAVYQILPLGLVAFHTGSGHRAAYMRPGWAQAQATPARNLSWWHERFPSLSSPLDLPFWRQHAHGINGRSWGLDFLAPRPGETYTYAQVHSAAKLVAYVAHSLGHPVGNMHVLDHSSVNPIDRSNAHGAWDLGESFPWDRFYVQLAAEYAARIAGG